MTILEILRLAVGLPLVLLLPGWMWSLAAFPGSRPLRAERTEAGELDVVERAFIAFALSIAAVMMAALAWSAGLGLPLGFWGSVAVVAVAAGSGAGAWRWRLSRARPAVVPLAKP